MARTVHLMAGNDYTSLDEFKRQVASRPQDFTLGLEAQARWDRYAARTTCFVGHWKLGGKEMDTRAHRLEMGAPASLEQMMGTVSPEDRLEPVETMLAALGASMLTAVVYNAQKAGIGFEGLEMTLSTTVDPGVLLGTRPVSDMASCLGPIRTQMRVIGDISPKALGQLKEMVLRSPVYGFISQPSIIEVQVQQLQPAVRPAARTVELEGYSAHTGLNPFGPENTEYAPESGQTADRLLYSAS